MESHLHKLRALAWLERRPHEFRPDFRAYLLDNWHVYLEFERRALQVAGRRDHYSARTIAEVIRHDTAIGELRGEWKLNNNAIPDMARLFAAMNPAYSGLFEFREHKAAA